MVSEFNFDVLIFREKASVWMFTCGALIEPIFYEGNLTGNTNLNMLNEQIITELYEINRNRMDKVW